MWDQWHRPSGGEGGCVSVVESPKLDRWSQPASQGDACQVSRSAGKECCAAMHLHTCYERRSAVHHSFSAAARLRSPASHGIRPPPQLRSRNCLFPCNLACMASNPSWPDLPLSAWSDTCETLHRWTQIVGKVRLVLTPLVNHWWNVTLYVTSRGLTTSPIPADARTFELLFDFHNHQLIFETSDGATERLALAPMSVAQFYSEVMYRLGHLGIKIRIWTMPSEIDQAVPFDQDHTHAQYDPVMVRRFWEALVQADRVFKIFRSRFIGKVSPVHFFWGSFD